MPNYSRFGKILEPIADQQFIEGMQKGEFKKRKHKGYCVALYYYATRKMETGRATPEQFTITKKDIIFNVGVRLKKSKRYRVCTCGNKNSGKAQFCKLCGTNISSTPLTKITGKDIQTVPLKLPREAAYAEELEWAIQNTPPKQRIWDYDQSTYWRIVSRAFKYPHLFRLSRITNFFADGFTVDQIHSWTGLSLTALNFYLGLTSINSMSKAMIKKQKKHSTQT